MKEVRLGIDVGGTFTDAVLWNESTNEMYMAKVLSTPDSFIRGVLNATDEILEKAKLKPGDITFVIHSSTVAANIVHTKSGAKVGLITTKGFRDILELQRQRRDDLYNLYIQKPSPLVPRYLRKEVPGRIDFQGSVIEELDEQAVRAAVRDLRRQECTSIAVVLLFSFVNNAHELRVKEIIEEEYPEAYISLSSVVNPEFREYERSNTTVIDAYIKPEVTRYYNELSKGLTGIGIQAPLSIVQSGGGLMMAGDSADRPVYTVESGAAAGAIAVSHVSTKSKVKHAIMFDMGGTTAKAAMIKDGKYETKNLITVDRQPCRTPVIDLFHISGGGGTIAWVDSSGLPRLGPKSAGSYPGPVCYNNGGTKPTICDSFALMGYLDASHKLGGHIAIDMDKAGEALGELGGQLGLDAAACAKGIIQIADADISGAMRVVSTKQGLDPRTCTLIAFGGAGPMMAAFIARSLGVTEVLIPPAPGNLNAFGALVSDMRYDYARTYYRDILDIDLDDMSGEYNRLRADVIGSFKDLNESDKGRLEIECYVDMRYDGQKNELTIPAKYKEGMSYDDWAAAQKAAFDAEHLRVYTYNNPGTNVELTALRVVAWLRSNKTMKLNFYNSLAVDEHVPNAPIGRRLISFPDTDAPVDAAIYNRNYLNKEFRCSGPAIIEEDSSTTVVPEYCDICIDEENNMIMKVNL